MITSSGELNVKLNTETCHFLMMKTYMRRMVKIFITLWILNIIMFKENFFKWFLCYLLLIVEYYNKHNACSSQSMLSIPVMSPAVYLSPSWFSKISATSVSPIFRSAVIQSQQSFYFRLHQQLCLFQYFASNIRLIVDIWSILICTSCLFVACMFINLPC